MNFKRFSTSDNQWHDVPYYVRINGEWLSVSNAYEYNSNYTIADLQTHTINDLQTHTISDLQGGEWSKGSSYASSWSDFRDLVRSGDAPELYPVGTKLYENWGDDTSNAWVIVDYPNDSRYIDPDLLTQGYTNRVVLMEEKLNVAHIGDNSEAWLYVETALSTGVYRFTIPDYDAAYGGNKTYIFTSTADVPIGGQLTLTWAFKSNPSAVQGYSSQTSETALFNASISEWDGTTACTDLGTIKLRTTDADSAYGKLNYIGRARYSSNNYYQSGIRQWLNANTASNWWTPSNIFDRPYSDRNTAGRLNTLNEDLKSVLAMPSINCNANNRFEYPSLDGTTFSLGSIYVIRDKLFLASQTEMNFLNYPVIDSTFSYYVNAENADRIKYRKDNGNASTWWLRSPDPNSPMNGLVIQRAGRRDGYRYENSFCTAACCVIQ